MKNGKMISINEHGFIGGNVKISQIKDGKVLSTMTVKNHGTQAICIYLRKVLSGNNVVMADRPGNISLCQESPGGGLENVGSITALFNNEPKGFEVDDVSSSCTLTFLIPSNVVSTATEIAGFRLYSKQTATLYAEINLKESGKQALEVIPGSNLKVE